MRWPRAASRWPSVAEIVRQLLNVGPGGKSFFARACQQNGANAVARRQLGEGGFELGEGRLIECVQHLGAIQRQDRQRLSYFKEDIFKAHGDT